RDLAGSRRAVAGVLRAVDVLDAGAERLHARLAGAGALRGAVAARVAHRAGEARVVAVVVDDAHAARRRMVLRRIASHRSGGARGKALPGIAVLRADDAHVAALVAVGAALPLAAVDAAVEGLEERLRGVDQAVVRRPLAVIRPARLPRAGSAEWPVL